MMILHSLIERVRKTTARALTVAVAAAFLTPAAGAQQHIPLPVDAALTTPRLELDLTNARVRVQIGPERQPRFSARLADPSTGQEAALEVNFIPGSLTGVYRPESTAAPTIVVDISMTEDQFLLIVGANLDVEIVGPVADEQPDGASAVEEDEPAAAEAQPEPATGSAITAVLTDSRLTTENLGGLSLTATRGANEITAHTGALALDLRESAARVHDHRGPITLHSLDSDSLFRNTEGAISADVNGGVWEVSQGRGAVTGELDAADVVLETVSGPIKLTGRNSSIRINGAPDSRTQISGDDLQIDLSDLGGPLNTVLTRGSLEAELLAGRVDLRLNSDVTADLRDVRGDLAAVVSDRSRVAIRGVREHTRIQLNESELEVGDLKSLDLDARDSIVTGSGIRALTNLVATDTTLELSLGDVMGKPKIDLRGGSQATIHLPMPCRVVAKLADASLSDQIRVSGCDLDFDGLNKRSLRPGPDGRQPRGHDGDHRRRRESPSGRPALIARRTRFVGGAAEETRAFRQARCAAQPH